jgi:hypothetical protein
MKTRQQVQAEIARYEKALAEEMLGRVGSTIAVAKIEALKWVLTG